MRNCFVAAILFSLLLSGCISEEVSVIDATTSRPIVDTWVSYTRIRHYYNSTACDESYSVKTDSQGKAAISLPSAYLFADYDYAFFAYKPGYEIVETTAHKIVLKPATTTPGDRLMQLHNLSDAISCSYQNRMHGNTDVQAAIVEEVLPLVARLDEFDKSQLLIPQINASESAHTHLKAICMNMAYEGNQWLDEEWSVDWLQNHSPRCFAEIARPTKTAGKECPVRNGCAPFCWSGVYVTSCNPYGANCHKKFEPVDNGDHHYPQLPECDNRREAVQIKELGHTSHGTFKPSRPH